MKIAKSELKLLIENYLINEARRDREWIEALNIPEEGKEEYRQAEAQGLKIPELSWIEKVRGTEPVKDIIPDVIEFKKSDFVNKIKTKSKRLNDPSILNQLNLSVKIYPTVNSLRAVIEETNVDISGLDRRRFVPLETGDDLEIVGKAGPWTVILPKTIRGSVSCDARTSKDTSWCTTKRSGQNLFYHYVGNGAVNMMLFYIMDYNRKPDDPFKERPWPFEANNDSRISLGVISGNPRMDGTNGGLSVDASNTGYEQDDLESALGSYYDEVMSLVNTSVQKHGGISPALKTVERAATNLDLLLKIIKDYDEEARTQFVIKVLELDNVSKDVLSYFSDDPNKSIRTAVANNENTPGEILNKMSEVGDYYDNVWEEIAENISTPPASLTILFNKTKEPQFDYDLRNTIQKSIAKNPSTPTELLTDIFNASLGRVMGHSVQTQLAKNPNLPLEIIEVLASSDSSMVRGVISANPATPASLVEKLAEDEDVFVKMYVFRGNFNKLSPSAIKRLSEDEDLNVRASVAYHSKDPELLEKLSNDPMPFVRQKVAINKVTPENTLEKLKNDKDQFVRARSEENLRNRQINESKRYSLNFLYN